jgi:hypothetical protein
MTRLAIALLACSAAAAAAADPAPDYSFQAGRLRASLQPGVPGEMTEGVKLWQSGIFVHADTIGWRNQRLPDGRDLLDWAEVRPGPNGPQPDRVHIDSTRSTLPSLAARVVMSPRFVQVERIPDDPQRPDRPQLRTTALGVGDFTCQLRAPAGWLPHRGWCKRLELFSELPPGETMPVVRMLVLHGENDLPRRAARIERSDERFGDQPPWLTGMRIEFTIGADGAIGEPFGVQISASNNFREEMITPFLPEDRKPR